MTCKFTIRSVVNEHSIKALTNANYHLYQAGVAARIYGIGILLLVLGVLAAAALGQMVSLVMLFLGCILIANGEYPAHQAAKTMLQSLGNQQPDLELRFFDARIHVTVAKKDGIVEYATITRLAEDSNYYFLFVGAGSAYVIKKDTVPEPGASAFKEFMESRTCLEFEPVKGFVKKILTFSPLKKR